VKNLATKNRPLIRQFSLNSFLCITGYRVLGELVFARQLTTLTTLAHSAGWTVWRAILKILVIITSFLIIYIISYFDAIKMSGVLVLERVNK